MTELLWTLLVLPLVFAGIIAWRPAGRARAWALGCTSVQLVLTVALLARFFAIEDRVGIAATDSIDWLPAFGLSLSIGIDGVAALLIGLTALLGPVCVLASWTAIQEKQRLFYGWLMVLQTAMIGVFAARDLMLFYICFEFTLLPMFILIGQFGSTNRKLASIKFFLYTFTGSLIALAGLVYVAWAASTRAGGDFTLDIAFITANAPRVLSTTEQAWVLLAMLCGFAVKVPLFPVHTWLPLAHTEAPTAGSVILAGVLLKLGTYAMYRFVLPFVPAAVYEYAPLIGVLSIIGIVYAGLICWVQTDVKKLVAYSSVSHLGFCVLGLFALNTVGIEGSILYMVNHGLSTGALFLLIGFMYERYHTRDMREIGGLASKMPVWSTFMVFFVMASVGLPGLNGFVSEFMCTMGAFQSYTGWTDGAISATNPADVVGATWGPLGPWFAAVAATGVIVAAIYLLYMTAQMVWGTYRAPAGHDAHGDEHGVKLPTDLGFREIATLAPIAALCLFFGLYPAPLINAIERDVNSTVQIVQDAATRDGITPPAPDAHGGAHSRLEGDAAGTTGVVTVTAEAAE